MSNDTKKDEGTPKFGLLLLVCVAAVTICALVVWASLAWMPLE